MFCELYEFNARLQSERIKTVIEVAMPVHYPDNMVSTDRATFCSAKILLADIEHGAPCIYKGDKKKLEIEKKSKKQNQY